MTRTCKICNLTSSDMKKFQQTINITKSGERRISYKKTCSKCAREKHKVKIQNTIENKRQFIRAYKNRPCMDCGNSYPFYVMDFDHVTGDKKFCVSQYTSASYKTLVEEISKCEVVCSNCHRIRTHMRRVNAVE